MISSIFRNSKQVVVKVSKLIREAVTERVACQRVLTRAT